MTAERETSRLFAWAQDHPDGVNALLVALVCFHALAARLWVQSVDPQRALSREASPGDTSVLFLGGATVAAMVAGFAGVVVVFALSSPADRIRLFRLKGGNSLLRNWTSCVSVSFLAAGLSLAGSYLRLVDGPAWGWAFELSIGLLLHGSIRLVWLLRKVARIVGSDDTHIAEKHKEAPVASVVLPDEEDS